MNGLDFARLALVIGAALAMEFFTYTWVLWGIAAVALYVADYCVRKELDRKTLRIVELESEVFKNRMANEPALRAKYEAQKAQLEAAKEARKSV